MTDLLTLRLDAHSQRHFEHMRQTHFPPERNLIPAHLTLFHTLPRSVKVATVLREAAWITPAFVLQVTGLRSLGRGVAYQIASPELTALHTRLARAFAADLSAQDQQKFQPHIVIQNKVTPATARALLAQLQPAFKPFRAEAVGLDLWHYLGGPWQHAHTFSFPVPPALEAAEIGAARDGADSA